MAYITDIPEMKTLTSCMEKLQAEGYTETFSIAQKHLVSPRLEKTYTPQEVIIRNFYRFEGESDPADSAILYAVETNDGLQGTLVDAYGSNSDPDTDSFIKKVTEISKQMP